MSKPPLEYCKKYCDLYPCQRTNCKRKPVLYPKGIKMEESSIWNKWRNAELKVAYYSVPLT